jgi:hypothetical protein
MNPESNETIEDILQKGWEVPSPSEKELYYSSDQMIDAYVKGTKDGEDLGKRLVKERFLTNLQRTHDDASELTALLQSENIEVLNGYLKVNSAEEFVLYLLIDPSHLLRDDILNILKSVNEFENAHNADSYNIEILLVGKGDEFNKDFLVADGFVFKHKVK